MPNYFNFSFDQVDFIEEPKGSSQSEVSSEVLDTQSPDKETSPPLMEDDDKESRSRSSSPEITEIPFERISSSEDEVSPLKEKSESPLPAEKQRSPSPVVQEQSLSLAVKEISPSLIEEVQKPAEEEHSPVVKTSEPLIEKHMSPSPIEIEKSLSPIKEVQTPVEKTSEPAEPSIEKEKSPSPVEKEIS